MIDGEEDGPIEDIGGLIKFYDFLYALNEASLPSHKAAEKLAEENCYKLNVSLKERTCTMVKSPRVKILLKSLLSTVIISSIILMITLNAIAHSGRTDSSGGHKDNKNASGLGSYHYHHGLVPICILMEFALMLLKKQLLHPLKLLLIL